MKWKVFGLKILIIHYEVITIIPFGHDRWFTSDVREILYFNEGYPVGRRKSLTMKKTHQTVKITLPTIKNHAPERKNHGRKRKNHIPLRNIDIHREGYVSLRG